MKIIHQNGYSQDELLTWKLTIFKNIIDSIQSVVAAMLKFEYDFDMLKEQVGFLLYFLYCYSPF